MPSLFFEEALKKLSTNDPTYKKLDLRNIEINPSLDKEGETIYTYDDDALHELAQALKDNYTIEEFDIHNINNSNLFLEWTATGIQAFITVLKNHPNLKTVNLGLNGYALNDDELLSFLNVLTGTANIQTLDLKIYSNNNLLTGFGNVLQKNNTLQCIYIEGGDFHNETHDSEAIEKFASGFSNKKLTSLSIKYLSLYDFGIKAISKALKENNSLINLSIVLCQLTSDGLTFINELLAKNNDLRSLNLSNNPLSESGLKNLADSLSLLPKLKRLSLSNIGMTPEALNYLVTVWKNYNLKINTFSFDEVDEQSVIAIGQLINGNKDLKKLNIDSEEISENHIKSIKKILSNPSLCKLKEFTFGMNQKWSPSFYNSLIEIMAKNPNLTRLSPSVNSNELYKAWDRNCEGYLNSQQDFINTIVKLCNIYFAQKEDGTKPHISILPVEIILLIICHLGRSTLGMEEADVIECGKLIFHNFEQRRYLIDENQYSSTTSSQGELPNIKKWWSMWAKRNDNKKQVFRTKTEIIKYADYTDEGIASFFSKRCNIM